MVKLLRKLFIKNYNDVGNPLVREKHGILASIGGILMNILLFAIKLTIGVLSFSMSIISDAINNLTDLFSCFVNLFGFLIAGKKADEKHPYGHERIEYIAGMIVSFVILAVALLLAYNSIISLTSNESKTTLNIWAFVVLGVGIVGKLLLGIYYYQLGKAINSVSLKAGMQDSFNDVISTTAVLIAAILQYFIDGLWWIDATMSLLIAVFIFVSGIRMLKETATPLIGVRPDKDYIDKILKDVTSIAGVLGVHDCEYHSYGPTRTFMSLHVEVDGYKDVFESHDLIDTIEQQIGTKYNLELTIHMDPIDTKNKELGIIKTELDRILSSIDQVLTFHDLRIVSGPTHSNIIFDVVKPYDCKITNEAIIKKIREEISNYNASYNCVIHIDNNYIE